MSEREFQDGHVVPLAVSCGWIYYHTHDSRRSPGGFPDLVLVRGGKLIFAELKSEKGRVSAAQKVWLAALKVVADLPGSPVEVWLWRPSDWHDIVRRLSRQTVA